MKFFIIFVAACMAFAVAAIVATGAWYFSKRSRPQDDEDDRVEPSDPIASRGPQVVLPDADDISEGPAFAPPRPAHQVAPQPVVIAPSARPMAPPPVAPSPAAASRPVGGGIPQAIPQAIPRPTVAPNNRNIVERASPLPRAAPPPGASGPAPAPPVAAAPVAAAPVAARPATPPPPAPRPPPGIPAGVTIVPNDLTPFGMQNQPRSPALRKKATPIAAPIPPSDRKKDG